MGYSFFSNEFANGIFANFTPTSKLLDLLNAQQISLYMEESEQLYPEQSITAIIAYYPTDQYFSA